MNRLNFIKTILAAPAAIMAAAKLFSKDHLYPRKGVNSIEYYGPEIDKKALHDQWFDSLKPGDFVTVSIPPEYYIYNGRRLGKTLPLWFFMSQTLKVKETNSSAKELKYVYLENGYFYNKGMVRKPTEEEIKNRVFYK